ncbi:MAG: substrate-binding domain-containing protein [Lachnospiraceae bacterium]
MYHTKKIGVFISHIFGNYQYHLCQGIADRAAEYGFITEIFTSTDGEDLGEYAQGEESILRIPNFNQFSGVILASETYLQKDLRDQIIRTLQEKCTCPVLEIAQINAHFPYLIFDNDSCATALTKHLIETHHCKRICYLGSESEPFFSEHRLALYREVLNEHGMEQRDEDFCNCTYEKESVESALLSWLQEETKPDAIICYNDRMAVILMELLFEKGIKIPEDIRVTGFDDLEIGRNSTPDLTTVTFPLYETGMYAFDLIMQSISSKKPLPPVSRIQANPIYRGSCCCEKTAKSSHSLSYESTLLNSILDYEHSMFEDIKLASSLYHITDLEDGMNLLEEYVSGIENCREFYICLYPNWNHISGHIQQITSTPDDSEDTDVLIMPFAYQDGIRLPSCSFTRKNILPDYLYKDANTSYIYAPLFFGKREFGYAAFSFQEGKVSAQFHLLLFLRNINTMLKHLCDNRQTELLLTQLKNISDKDELTGLPNRHGFRLSVNSLLHRALEEKQAVLIMQFSLSDMQEITRLYGRSERDFAICVAGHAIENSVDKDVCISHQGGGEFLLLALYEDTKQADAIENRIHQYLNNYNRLHSKPYDITVTASSRSESITSGTNMEDLFSIVL